MVFSPLTLVSELVGCSNLVVEVVVEGAMSLLSYQRALLGGGWPAGALAVLGGLWGSVQCLVTAGVQ